MSFTIAPLDLHDAQQRDDLAKIYNESPLWMLRDLPPEEFVRRWVEPCDQIWGGWVNGRVVATVGVRNTAHGQQLIGLCVRKSTRRHGFAFALMSALLPKLEGRVFIDTRQQASTDLLFDKLGFRKEELRKEEGGITWVRWDKHLPVSPS
jgi:GNAT superfamily N-acetyltransferase